MASLTCLGYGTLSLNEFFLDKIDKAPVNAWENKSMSRMQSFLAKTHKQQSSSSIKKEAHKNVLVETI